MMPLYFFALLATAFSLDIPCKDGVEIKSQPIRNAGDMVGNWTYSYHWDNLNEYSTEFMDESPDRELRCPEIEIVPAAPEFVQEKLKECGDDKMPFKWDDAKLKLVAPLMNIKDSIIFMGEKESWMMVDCKKMVRVEAKMVSDDVMVMINPDVAKTSEMMSRKPMRLSEVKCLAHNMDVGKGMKGIGLC